MMSSEATAFVSAVLMVAAGMLGGWLLCARFLERSFGRRDGERDRLIVASWRQLATCLVSDMDGHGNRLREISHQRAEFTCQAIDAIRPDQQDFTSGAARNDSRAGDFASRLGDLADTTKPARPDSAHAATARDPIGNETAVPSVRNTFSLALGHRLTEPARCGEPLSVVLVRIDNYQGLRDRYGLQAGNQTIDAVGKFFIASVRGTDWIARFDMTTFAFLLRNTAHANALRVAERLRTTISSANVSGDGPRIPLTLSLGTTEAMPGDNSHAILRRAEEAMNASIRMGGNRIHSHVGGRLETAQGG
jgi:diguanylate cyclase (GGDEF)-like protein